MIKTFLPACLVLLLAAVSLPQTRNQAGAGIYRAGWIDFNKNGRKDPYEDASAPVEKRVEDLLAQMTLEEKTNQLATLYGFGRVLKDELPTPEWKLKVWKDGIGNIDEHLNGVAYHPQARTQYSYPYAKHVEAINTVQRWFVEETRLGIPVDFTNEGLHGLCHDRATAFPGQINTGSAWDRDLIRRIGHITGREARALGYTNIYSPILDIARDPRWGRTVETYGEDPYLVSALGAEMVKGLQAEGVVSTLKHFAVYSAPKGGRDGEARTDPHIAFREMHEVYLAPFRAAVRDAGALGVMSSYNDYDGVPVSASRYFLTDILRGQWGFRGYVVSDSRAVEFVSGKHRVAPDYKDAVRQVVEAGLNVRTDFTSPAEYILPLRELVREGRLSPKTLDERVREVLRVKFWLGLFDRPYFDAKAAEKIVRTKDALDTSLRASRESLVLLKNAGNVLPLDRERVKTVFVTGPNAAEVEHSVSRYGPSNIEVVSVLEGIRRFTGPGVEVKYAKGCELVDARYPESEILPEPPDAKAQRMIDEAAAQAKTADVAIVVLGEDNHTVGEGYSRTSLDLPGHQLDLLKAIVAAGKPVVLVLVNGRPLTINWADRHVPAIVEAWFPGEFGGQAVAEVLFGAYNPGGKLPLTFPKTVGQIPFNFPFKPGSQANEPARGFGGHGRSQVQGALYPFGHGLSYTTFAYANLRISPEKQRPAGAVSVSVDVRNAGGRAGDEVVQLYVADKVSSVTVYEKQLRGFERVHLRPGETRTVTFNLQPEDLMLLDRDMNWTTEPGEFEVMLGSSSEDIRLKKTFEIVR
jgi:beta-glucosidase